MYNNPFAMPIQGATYNRATLMLVSSVQEIEQIPVLPGERIWAMSTNDAVIGCRTGGDMGVQTTYCKLEPYTPPVRRPEDYVTKADLEEMFSRFAAQQGGQKGAKKDG